MGKCKDCCKNFLKGFDIFGAQVTFRINGDGGYNSKLGGLMTILFVVIVIGYSAYNAFLFLTRQNVNFIFTNKVYANKPVVNITGTNFMIAVGANYYSNSSSAMEEMKEYLDIVLIHHTIEVKGEKLEEKTVELEFDYCNRTHFPDLTEDVIYTMDVEMMLCPKNKTQFEKLSLEGLFTDNTYSYFEVDISLLDSNDDEFVALTKLNPILATIMFLDTGIIYDNLTDPLPKYAKLYNTPVDNDMIKKVDIKMSNLQFESDENWLWANPQKSVSVVQDTIQETIIDASQRTEMDEDLRYSICLFKIEASQRDFIVQRTYQKLPNLLADLTGLLSQILFLLYLYLSYSNEKEAEQKMITKTLKFKQKQLDYLQENYSKIDQRGKADFERNPSANNNIFVVQNKNEIPSVENSSHTISRNENNLMQPKNMEMVQIKENNVSLHPVTPILKSSRTDSAYSFNSTKDIKIKPIQLLFKETFCCCCENKDKRLQLRNHGQDKIFFYLDVLTYIRKMQELDILKHIILSKEQLSLFQFLSKPAVSINSSESRIYNEFLEDQKKQFSFKKEDIDGLLENFKKLVEKPVKTDDEIRLLNLFNAEVESLK